MSLRMRAFTMTFDASEEQFDKAKDSLFEMTPFGECIEISVILEDEPLPEFSAERMTP